MKRAELTVEACIHGITYESVREAWKSEYELEQAGERSSAVSCSCCMGPSYGSWTCPACSLGGEK